MLLDPQVGMGVTELLQCTTLSLKVPNILYEIVKWCSHVNVQLVLDFRGINICGFEYLRIMEAPWHLIGNVPVEFKIPYMQTDNDFYLSYIIRASHRYA